MFCHDFRDDRCSKICIFLNMTVQLSVLCEAIRGTEKVVSFGDIKRCPEVDLNLTDPRKPLRNLCSFYFVTFLSHTIRKK